MGAIVRIMPPARGTRRRHGAALKEPDMTWQRMRHASATLLATFITFGSGMAQDNNAVLKEIAPTGTLRVGVAVGPSPSPMWATKDAAGKPVGVTVDLGSAFARSLGVPAEIVVHASSGEITQALVAGKLDVGFMPVDDERKQMLGIGTNYALGESTYLVAPGSKIKSIAEIDQAGVRVLGVENTTTIRAARRTLKHATVTGSKGSVGILELVRDGKVDAVALGRDTLEDFAAELPGSRVLDGHFWAVGYAIAVQKDKPAALAAATDFIETAKADGMVQRAFDAAKLKDPVLAPAGSRS
jgi:polar amino acid transport system substrate-binding protein